ncbi:MAG: exo-beta-N-acetylmuramidase NamZ family protein [Saprospiraceae bacterium]
MKNWFKFSFLLFIVIIVSCANNEPTESTAQNTKQSSQQTAQDEVKSRQVEPKKIVLGASKFTEYLPQLNGKKVGLVVNQTSAIDERHLVDILLEKKVNITKIFAPEHGFRGKADAGELVKSGKDVKTGLPIISLYGANKKPSKSMIQDLDILIFDIQDVGARFYTYISTMHYVMEAAAENDKKVIVLDRPNPNGHYIDGPIRKDNLKSFVGMHPIPIVHGLTVGELAKMINGERWLKGGLTCDLTVIKCDNYDHNTFYELPIKPSPNLPNIRSIYLYPSLCLFEGTVVSVGRGTATPFQIYGHPAFKGGNYEFTPKPTEGAKNPPYNGKLCNGFSLLNESITTLQQAKRLELEYLIDYYNAFPQKDNFFNNFLPKLVGNYDLRKQIESGKTAAEIRATWEKDLESYRQIRKNYLLYNDFK